MCKTLSIELKKLGHQIEVISLYDTHTHLVDELTGNGIQVHFLHKHIGLDLSIRRKVRRIIENFSPDIIHTHLDVNKYVPFVGKKVKHFHTVHNLAEKEAAFPDTVMNKYVFRHGLIVPVALNQEVRKSIINFYGLSQSSIPIVFNGVPLEQFIRKRDYSVHDDFTLIHVACFRPQKNHRNLVEGFAKALKENKYLRLLLVGDGELYGEIKNSIEQQNLDSKITLLGNRSDVVNLLYDADCFILPSNYEGMPISMIEAMGSAMPIIATAVGSVPDMIVHNFNGYLCDTSPNSICEAILKLADDESLRKRLGQNALENARNNYSAQAMAESYCKLYDGVGGKQNE